MHSLFTCGWVSLLIYMACPCGCTCSSSCPCSCHADNNQFLEVFAWCWAALSRIPAPTYNNKYIFHSKECCLGKVLILEPGVSGTDNEVYMVSTHSTKFYLCTARSKHQHSISLHHEACYKTCLTVWRLTTHIWVVPHR